MASVEKFTMSECFAQLNHNSRGISNPSNPDINHELTHLNEHLEPERDISNYDYLKKRLSELYVYGRKDVITMAGWVVTAPRELPVYEQERFFQEVYKFLENRYGGPENVVQAVVHYDEGGQPHLHFCFVPVVPDKKHEQGLKVCANDLLNKTELRNFHPALQKALSEALIDVNVNSGITAKNGRNYTVKELKQEIHRNHKHSLSGFEWGE